MKSLGTGGPARYNEAACAGCAASRALRQPRFYGLPLRDTVALLVSDFSDVALPALPSVPGMTSPSECRYYYWLASSQLTGVGQLVEVGSWLGRSALHLAAGLESSGKAATLHCFDGFTWGAGDSRAADLPLRPGDNFQKYFEANVSRFAHRIAAHRTRISDIAWKGDPIELLFLDAPKKHRDITSCLEAFGPSLIPGKSVIAIQDYLYFPAYALAVGMYVLREHLDLVHVLLDGSTVGFRVTGTIDLQRKRPADWNPTRWSPAAVNVAWDAILGALPARARERIEPGRALHLYDCGARQQAVQAIKALPMTHFQQKKIAYLAQSHHYLSYPELFTAAGYPGSARQNLLSRAKRLRDWACGLRAAS